MVDFDVTNYIRPLYNYNNNNNNFNTFSCIAVFFGKFFKIILLMKRSYIIGNDRPYHTALRLFLGLGGGGGGGGGVQKNLTTILKLDV